MNTLSVGDTTLVVDPGLLTVVRRLMHLGGAQRINVGKLNPAAFP